MRQSVNALDILPDRRMTLNRGDGERSRHQCIGLRARPGLEGRPCLSANDGALAVEDRRSTAFRRHRHNGVTTTMLCENNVESYIVPASERTDDDLAPEQQIM